MARKPTCEHRACRPAPSRQLTCWKPDTRSVEAGSRSRFMRNIRRGRRVREATVIKKTPGAMIADLKSMRRKQFYYERILGRRPSATCRQPRHFLPSGRTCAARRRRPGIVLHTYGEMNGNKAARHQRRARRAREVAPRGRGHIPNAYVGGVLHRLWRQPLKEPARSCALFRAASTTDLVYGMNLRWLGAFICPTKVAVDEARFWHRRPNTTLECQWRSWTKAAPSTPTAHGRGDMRAL